MITKKLVFVPAKKTILLKRSFRALILCELEEMAIATVILLFITHELLQRKLISLNCDVYTRHFIFIHCVQWTQKGD